MSTSQQNGQFIHSSNALGPMGATVGTQQYHQTIQPQPVPQAGMPQATSTPSSQPTQQVQPAQSNVDLISLSKGLTTAITGQTQALISFLEGLYVYTTTNPEIISLKQRVEDLEKEVKDLKTELEEVKKKSTTSIPIGQSPLKTINPQSGTGIQLGAGHIIGGQTNNLIGMNTSSNNIGGQQLAGGFIGSVFPNSGVSVSPKTDLLGSQSNQQGDKRPINVPIGMNTSSTGANVTQPQIGLQQGQPIGQTGSASTQPLIGIQTGQTIQPQILQQGQPIGQTGSATQPLIGMQSGQPGANVSQPQIGMQTIQSQIGLQPGQTIQPQTIQPSLANFTAGQPIGFNVSQGGSIAPNIPGSIQPSLVNFGK